MSGVVLHFDKWTVEQLTGIHSRHSKNKKAAIYKGVRYVQANPGEVAAKTALVGLPIIAAGAAAGAGVGAVAAGGVGAPLAAPLGAGIGAGVALGTVVGVAGAIVHIARSDHYREWEKRLPEQCIRSILATFEGFLKQQGDTDGLIDPVSGHIIRLPVRAEDSVYDYESVTERKESVGELTFDFPSAEKMIRHIEGYRKGLPDDEHRKVTEVALCLIEKTLYEEICLLWSVEDQKLQKSWNDRKITSEEYSRFSMGLQDVFRLRSIARLLVDNPLISQDFNELLAEFATDTGHGRTIREYLAWIEGRMRDDPQVARGVAELVARKRGEGRDQTSGGDREVDPLDEKEQASVSWVERLMNENPVIAERVTALVEGRET